MIAPPTLDAKAIDLACKLLRENGLGVLDDAKVLRSLVRDYFGGKLQQECELLLIAERYGALREIKKIGGVIDDTVLAAVTIQLVSDAKYLSLDAARFAVYGWATAIAKTSLPKKKKQKTAKKPKNLPRQRTLFATVLVCLLSLGLTSGMGSLTKSDVETVDAASLVPEVASDAAGNVSKVAPRSIVEPAKSPAPNAFGVGATLPVNPPGVVAEVEEPQTSHVAKLAGSFQIRRKDSTHGVTMLYDGNIIFPNSCRLQFDPDRQKFVVPELWFDAPPWVRFGNQAVGMLTEHKFGSLRVAIYYVEDDLRILDCYRASAGTLHNVYFVFDKAWYGFPEKRIRYRAQIDEFFNTPDSRDAAYSLIRELSVRRISEKIFNPQIIELGDEQLP